MKSQKRFIKRSRRKPSELIEIANERIDILFSRAQLEFALHPELSNRYVEIARDIAKKFNIHIPIELRRKFCKNCGSYLVPGNNLTVRLLSKEKKVIRKCGVCGDEKKVPYRL
ncbi:MAG: ribonuclease P protein component 4 [Nanoarchaeota archaeon]|nr:ribonuclease P [Nanoarchaeota archaeon]MBU4452074.1 ribonuclease P [Nanoarchaeota archaeon]MCG2724455.1 ribonuclease P [archaeon]